MIASPSPPHRRDRIHGFVGDEDGAAMIEFVILAPVLCYLFIGIFFFHHHIDYAQDAIACYRYETWTKVLPNNVINSPVNDSASDSFSIPGGSLFPSALNQVPALATIRTAIVAAPLFPPYSVTTGTPLAAERYYGGASLSGSPYDTMRLPRNTYWIDDTRSAGSVAKDAPVTQIKKMPANRWAPILGQFGSFFGHRFSRGAGSAVPPSGYQDDWYDWYPLVTDPWQRYLGDNQFGQLAASKFLGVGSFVSGGDALMLSMNGFTLARNFSFYTDPSRLLFLHKYDNKLNGPTKQPTNAIKTIRPSNMQKLIK